ncbi:c-type cytochrome [Diaphorobacter caeni]|uniref:c-type cytochrome n=1 Tax=Diaphorobacter caeni TaxID=2784387 RepID=UPI0018904C79|nr:c-type cytochrome [Diaphorobacter caeni]MBF5006134.1 c-type cytochrome [Diaphorobacter caeni]
MKLLRTSTVAAAALMLSLFGAGSAMAQATQDASRALHTRQLAANCAACHGTDGKAAAGSPLATLAGMPADKMLASLQDFKNGKREATVMHQLAKGLTDDQMKTLADYFAAQKP